MTYDSAAVSILTERVVDDVNILAVKRSLKGAGEAVLKDRLDALVAQGHFHILIDLKNVPYMDSSEIGRLIRCHLSVRQAGGRVRLCNISDKLMTVLRMTRLDTVLDLFSTEEVALAAFRGTPGPGTPQECGA
jgi:anti-anti-sigma factor